MKIRPRRTCVLAAALGLSVLTGCSDEPPDLAAPPVVASPARTEPLLPSPLQKYRLTPTELTKINYARGILMDTCMRGFGLTYPQHPYDDELQQMLAAERTSLSRLYGVSDRADAARYGYGFPPSSPAPWRPSDEKYRRVLHGDLDPRRTVTDRSVPQGGCAGDADRRIGRTDPDVSAYGLAHDLWIEAHDRVLGSPAYAAAARDWVRCMARRGFEVTDPVSDRGAIAWVFRARQAAGDEGLTRRPVTGEVELALADVECKASVRFRERMTVVSVRVDARAVRAHRSDLEMDRQRLDRQLARAEALIRGDPETR